MQPTYSLYVLRNKLNGKCYVGQTKKTIEERLTEHVNKAREELPKMLIAKAIRRYGTEAFELIESKHCPIEESDKLEEELIIYYNALQPYGYNILKFGQLSDLKEGWWKNKSRSDETKKKISESKIGTQAGENNPFYGKHHSKEIQEKIKNGAKDWWANLTKEERETFIQKLSESKKGHEVSPETREKISAAKKGKRMSDKSIEKMRATKTGSKWSDKQRAALEKVNLGRVHTEEAKVNYTKAQHDRVPAETKARILRVKELILEGRDNKTIADLTGTEYEMVRNIRRDRRGKSVPWPAPYAPPKGWTRS